MLTMAIHQSEVGRTRFMIIQSTDLSPAGHDVALLHQELFGDLLIGDDNELLTHHACAVNGALQPC